MEPFNAPIYPFALPPLRFEYGALEPYFDERTLRLHHGRHHRAHVEGLNAVLRDVPSLHGRSIESILRGLDHVPAPIRDAVRRHGGGHANHQFFWKIIGPPGTRPSGHLLHAIESDFGSFGGFKARFTQAAVEHFASGWMFLVLDPKSQRLELMSLPGNDSVLGIGKLGLLICDVWEHAYCLRYEDRRSDFLAAFWNVVDWNVVGARLAAFRGEGLLS